MSRLRPESVLAFLLAAAVSAPAAAAEFRITPVLGLTEDITDNSEETPSHRKSELLTVVQPGAAVKYATSASTFEAAYHLDYRYYALGTRDNEIGHTLAALGTFSLVDEFLKLDISDTYSRISLDVARNTTVESAYHNQTDENIATFSPYMQWQLGEATNLKIGGRYSDIRYWTQAGIDRREAGGFAELTHQVTPRLGVTARYVYNLTRTEPVIYRVEGTRNLFALDSVSYYDNSVSGGFKYEFSERSSLFGTVGYSWQHFSYCGPAKNYFWDGGISNQFGRTSVTLESARRYEEDPLTISLRHASYGMKIDRTMGRGTLGLHVSYDDYVATGNGVLAKGELLTGDTSIDAEAAAENREGITVSLTGTRELSQTLTSSLTISGDHLNRRVLLDYPYHLAATGTVSWLMGPMTTMDFTYTYATYRYKLDQARGSVDINRFIVQMKRSF